MKRIVFIFTIIAFLSGFILVEKASAKPGKPAGKHKSHKKAKKSKSSYFFNFQH
jgi:hypothetical protein